MESPSGQQPRTADERYEEQREPTGISVDDQVWTAGQAEQSPSSLAAERGGEGRSQACFGGCGARDGEAVARVRARERGGMRSAPFGSASCPARWRLGYGVVVPPVPPVPPRAAGEVTVTMRYTSSQPTW